MKIAAAMLFSALWGAVAFFAAAAAIDGKTRPALQLGIAAGAGLLVFFGVVILFTI